MVEGECYFSKQCFRMEGAHHSTFLLSSSVRGDRKPTRMQKAATRGLDRPQQVNKASKRTPTSPSGRRKEKADLPRNCSGGSTTTRDHERPRKHVASPLTCNPDEEQATRVGYASIRGVTTAGKYVDDERRWPPSRTLRRGQQDAKARMSKRSRLS